MADERRAVVFGREAATYDEARPGYPDAVVERFVGMVDATVAVEVGAGTGKATRAVARPGLTLTCLEPSPQMAAILDSKDLPGVSVEVTTFEEWRAEPDSTDLIYAAQAWHWVDRQAGFDKALTVLRPGGVLALMWNIPLDRYSRHEDTYSRLAPQLLVDRDERIARRDDHDWCDDMDRAGLVETHRFTHQWSEELTGSRYRSLYATYSDHILLEEPNRTLLLDALEADVDEWGGTATVEYRTEVFTGRKPTPDRR